MASNKPLGNMVIELDLNSSAFGKGLQGAKKAVTSSMKAMRAEMKIMDASGNKMGVLESKRKGLSRTLEAQREEIKRLEQAYKESFDSEGNATKATGVYANKLNDARGKAASLEKQIGQTDEAIKKLAKQKAIDASPFTKMGKQLDAIGTKMKSVGDKMTGIGKSMSMKVTAPIVAGFGYAYKSATDFSGEMSTIRALLNDGSVKQSTLSQQIKEMGDQSLVWSTKYGISTDSINTGMEEIIKKGYNYKQTMGAMPSILDASVASGDDFNTVMSVSTSVLEQFGLKADSTQKTLKNTQRVTDSLTYVANLTASGFSDLGEAMEYVGPVANSLGMNVEETASAVGLLSNNGIEGAKAGTVLRGALSRLLKPSKQNIEGFGALGVKYKDFQSGAIGLPEVLDQITKGTKGMTGAQKTQALALAFGTEAQSGMNILVNQGAGALRDLTKDTQGATGYTKKMADEMNNTDKNQLAKFKESVKALSVTFGQQLLPVFTPIIEKLTELVTGFTKMDDSTQRTILVVGGIAAAVGPALMALGSMSKGFGTITGALGSVSKHIGEAGGLFGWLGKLITPLISPIGIVALAIAGIGTALVVTLNKGKSFKDIFGGIIESVKGGIDWFVKLGGAIKNIFTGDIGENRSGMDTLKSMFGEETGRSIYENLMKIKDTISKAWSDISGFFMDQASGLITFWNENGAQFITALQNFWAIIKPIVTVALGIVVGIIKNVWDSIKGVISGAVTVIEGIIQVFTGIFTGDFSKMWEGVKNIFFGAIQVIWNWINLQFIGKILKGFGGLVGGAKGIVSGMWTTIKTFFSGGIKSVLSNVTQFGSSILSKFRILRAGGANVIKSMWGAISATFKNTIGKVLGFVKNFFTRAISHFKNLRSSGQSVIGSLWSGIKNTFSKGISTVVGWMKALPGKMATGIRNGAGKVSAAFKHIFTAAKKAIGKPINGIIGGANWVLGKFGVKKKIEAWKYAKGTKGHPGGTAMVNDGRGAELMVRPNGQAILPRGRNVIVPNMEKGMQVIPAEETAQILGYNQPKYYYKGGTWDKIKSTAGNIWSGTKKVAKKVKKKIGDIWDYATHPSKLINKVIGNFVDYDGMGGIALDMGKGLVTKTKDAMKSWVSGLFDEYGSSGSFDGKIGAHGVYAYLVKVAKDVMRKYPGMTITSGYREGDPYYHGKHQAIDIAYPSSMNGSKKYFEPANYAFNKFKKQVAYVITQGRVKDRSGLSGQGRASKWVSWPDHDHFDHLHINGMWGPGDVGKGSGKGPKASGGHKNWMRLAGFKPSEYSAINWIVNHESGWNVRATNPSSGAYGLPQSLPGSKMASAGSDWRTNPVTQLRWMRKYVNSRYGGANGAIRFWKSHNWYENGGLITQPGFFAGEHFKPEMMLPLTDKARSLQLMSKAQRIMGVSNKTDTIQVDGNNNDETNEKLDTLIEIMSDFGEDLRNLKVILNGKQLATEVTNQQNRSTMLRKRAGGVRT